MGRFLPVELAARAMNRTYAVARAGEWVAVCRPNDALRAYLDRSGLDRPGDNGVTRTRYSSGGEYVPIGGGS
jgi:hypothetical protein